MDLPKLSPNEIEKKLEQLRFILIDFRGGLNLGADQFWINRNCVSISEYRKFIQDHPQPLIARRGQDPVVAIFHQQALDYVSWFSRLHGIQFSLPRKAEWELATKSLPSLIKPPEATFPIYCVDDKKFLQISHYGLLYYRNCVGEFSEDPRLILKAGERLEFITFRLVYRQSPPSPS